MLESIIYYFLFFIIISFFGYIIEVIYCSILFKKVVNRGFFFGPICPIYGVGCLLIALTLKDYTNPLIIFITGMTLTSATEYIVSYALEKAFNAKWWDYSTRKDNINGRICLLNCILFGICSLFIVFILLPFYDKIFYSIDYNLLKIISLILFILLFIDATMSLIVALNLRDRLILANELKNDKIKKIPIIVEKKYKNRISNLHLTKNRLLKAFPNITLNISKELDIITAIKKKLKKKNK